MALNPVPWFVGGGAQHSPEVARELAWVATSGASGIVNALDLQVQALPVPGTSVNVMPGGAVIENLYPGGAQQSYIARNESLTAVSVAPTDSYGARSDLLVLRIDDPQYGGTAPSDPTVGPYVRFEMITNVADTATTIPNQDYPAIPLARIDIPASTATIEQSMITSLRKMAVPRSLEVLRIHASLDGDAGLTLSSTSDAGEWFPNAGGNQDIDIPEWAVRAQIEASWLNMPVGAGGNPWGSMWVEFGPYTAPSRETSTQRFSYDTNSTTNNQRVDWHIADDVYVPPEYRGTTQGFTMYANIATGYSGSVKPSLDSRSGVIMRVKFLEQPDLSTS